MTRKQQDNYQIGIQISWRLESGRQMMQGILDFADRRGDWTIISDMHFDAQFAKTNRLDGMIAMAFEEPAIRRLTAAKFPVVGIGTTRLAGRVPFVGFDNMAIGRMAASHLLRLGFSELAYFDHHAPLPDERLAGFLEVAEAEGVTVHKLPTNTPHNFDPVHGARERVYEWVSKLPLPIGVFAYNDLDALEVAAVAQRAKLHIPNDMALLGVDNDSILTRVCHPNLSSIDHGAKQVGYRAAEMLEKLIRGESVSPDPVRLPPVGVITRPSTDTMALSDPDVVMALRMIRSGACDGLRADQVIAKVSVSRTALENRFRALLGRSIHQEIVRLRMEKAMYLLRETDLDMPQITDRSGFKYPSQVSHLFRKHLGLSPRQYRAKMRTTG